MYSLVVVSRKSPVRGRLMHFVMVYAYCMYYKAMILAPIHYTIDVARIFLSLTALQHVEARFVPEIETMEKCQTINITAA